MSTSAASGKRRRVTRACDTCRRRKAKCDADATPGTTCKPCMETDLICSWEDAVRKRGRKRQVQAYYAVEVLEARLNALEQAITATPQPGTSPSVVASDSPASQATDESEEADIRPLIERVSRLELTTIGQGGTFELSHSTTNRIARKVIELSPGYSRPEPFILQVDPWEDEDVKSLMYRQRHYTFPPPDLLPALVCAYMTHINPYVPLLHRPTFEALVTAGEHLRDPDFASLLLLICALGSHYVDDPRVLLPGRPKRSSGWAYWREAGLTCRDLLGPPRLYTIQAYIVGALFIGPCYSARAAWSLVGVGLRLLQEVGAHRKKVYGSRPNLEDELWKRAFWSLFQFDVTLGSETGRPCLFTDGQFDVEFPADCDDAYWKRTNGSESFKQPVDVPCQMSYFIHFIKLKVIQIKAMRTMFFANVELSDSRTAVASVESELSAWEAGVPKHLQWGPTRAKWPIDDVFFVQAAKLRLEYAHLRIIIHRPFISTRQLGKPESATALALCTSVAHTSGEVLGAVNERYLMLEMPQSLLYAHTTALVLLLSLGGARETGMRMDTTATLVGVQYCLDALLSVTSRYRFAEWMYHRLSGLAHSSNIPEVNAEQPTSSRKRTALAGEEAPNESPGFSVPTARYRQFSQGPQVEAIPPDAPSSHLGMPLPQWQANDLLTGLAGAAPGSLYSETFVPQSGVPSGTSSFDRNNPSTGSSPSDIYGDKSRLFDVNNLPPPQSLYSNPLADGPAQNQSGFDPAAFSDSAAQNTQWIDDLLMEWSLTAGSPTFIQAPGQEFTEASEFGRQE